MTSHSAQHADSFQDIYDKLLGNAHCSNSPFFSVSSLLLSDHKKDKTFFDVIYPTPDLVDIMIVHVHLDDPYALIIATALKFAVRRFALPVERGYYFDKARLWEKNLLAPHEIVQNVQQELAHILQNFDSSVSFFYGRFHLSYHTFTYLNCGLGTPFLINQKQKPIFLKRNWTTISAKSQSLESACTSIKPGEWLVYHYSDLIQDKEEADNADTYNVLIDNAKEYFHHTPSKLIKQLQKQPDFLNRLYPFKDNCFILAFKANSDAVQTMPRKGKSGMFSSDFSQLSAVRLLVREICQQAPSNYEELGLQLQLAVDELFCNIVKHAYQNQSRRQILLKSEYMDDGLYLTLSDQGLTFNPLTINYPNLTGEKESGFGFFIVQQIADHISYIPKKAETDWNHIRIFKRYFSEGDHMELSHYIKDDKLVIAPNGENLDAKNAPAFKEEVLALLQRTEISKIILDLTHLQFIDSSGLGVLLSLQRTLHTQGGALKLVHLNKPIRTMFEIVSMHRIFNIFNTVDEALQSFD